MRRLVLLIFQGSAISVEWGATLYLNGYTDMVAIYQFVLIGLLVGIPASIYVWRTRKLARRIVSS